MFMPYHQTGIVEAPSGHNYIGLYNIDEVARNRSVVKESKEI